jgi:hypothetical protein
MRGNKSPAPPVLTAPRGGVLNPFGTNKNYDHCSFVQYTNNQMEMMKNEFIERINRIKNSEDYKLPELYYNEEYYDELNINDIGKYKDEIIKMIEELVLWMESIKENEITILGI